MPPRSKCGTCGTRVGVGPGQPAPKHQAGNDRTECPGSGQPTAELAE
jgi:hypothetical protein